jgi:hypothetical protein
LLPELLVPELLLGCCEPLDPPELAPELVPELEVPPLLVAPPPEDPLPELASPDPGGPSPWKPGPAEDPPQPVVTPSARVRIGARQKSSARWPRWRPMSFPFSFFIFRRSTFPLQFATSMRLDIGSTAGIR